MSESTVLCPHCGYDLRGLDSTRCPECGQPILTAASPSLIPWTRRRQIGTFRAYVQTVWLTLRRPRLIEADLDRPVSLRDARAFNRITSLLLSIPFLGVVAFGYWATARQGGVDLPQDLAKHPWQGLLVFDVELPFAFGWLLAPVMAVLCVAAVFGATRALSWTVNRRNVDVVRRARATALALYLPAMTLVWPAVLIVIAAYVMVIQRICGGPIDDPAFTPAPAFAALMALEGLLLVSFVLVMLRLGRFYAVVVGQNTFTRRVFGAARVMVAAMLVFSFWLLAVPWATGMIWTLWRGGR